jgi:hypothetical protein
MNIKNTKFLIIFLFILVNINLSLSFSGSGFGTQTDPYVITTCVQLSEINNARSSYYILGNNIDCTFDTQDPAGVLYNTGAGFDPIGDVSTDFTGTLDGRGRMITGLKIYRPTLDYVGLIAVNVGNISSIRFKDANITGRDSVGIVVGSHVRHISYISTNGTVTGVNYVGGISGQLSYITLMNPVLAYIKDSYSQANTTGSTYVAGLVGRTYGFNSNSLLIADSYSTGKVVGTSNVAGLANRGPTSAGEITVWRSYWDVQTSGSSLGLGIGKTTAELKGSTTFLNWDNAIWYFNSNDYPRLRYGWTGMSGSGTLLDPFIITNCEQLQDINNNLNAYYILGNNIDCTYDTHSGGTLYNGGRGFDPIGSIGVLSFRGNLNGRGYVIEGLMINRTDEDYIGFIAYNQGNVSNIQFKNMNISGRDYVGTVAGTNRLGIANTSVNGTVKGRNQVGGFAGAIVAEAGYNSLIKDSYTQANVTGVANVGGFTGDSIGGFPSITKTINCYSTGKVTGTTNVGGFLGVIGQGGVNSVTMLGCFWDIQTSGMTTSAQNLGSGRLTSELKNSYVYFLSGLHYYDFERIWKLKEDIDYPRLRYNDYSDLDSYCIGTPTYQVLKVDEDQCRYTPALFPPTYCYYSSDNNINSQWIGNRTHYSTPPNTKNILGYLGKKKCISGAKIYIDNIFGLIPATPQKMNLSSAFNKTPISATDYYLDFTFRHQNWNLETSREWNEVTFQETVARYVNLEMTDCTSQYCAINEFQVLTRELCDPKTCSELVGTQCGEMNDGCGTILTCNPCPTGTHCYSGSCISGGLFNAYFSDMNNNPINKTDREDLVKLIANGSGLLSGEIEFEIWKSIPFWFDQKIITNSQEGFITWRAGIKPDGSFESGIYYFKARFVGDSDWTDSRNTENYGTLEVNDERFNNPPHAEIISPSNGEVYFKTDQILINQSSYDVDDFFNYTWNITDNQIFKGSTKDNARPNYQFNINFLDAGEKKISLDIIDERGLSDHDELNIFILDLSVRHIIVYAGINSPKRFETINSTTIFFNANSSYAINITGPPDNKIVCLAGNCPLTTFGGTAIYDDYNQRGNFSAFTYNWTFDDGVKYHITGSEGLNFTRNYGSFGEHSTNLNLKLDTEENNVTTTFNINFVNRCENEGLIWWDAFGIRHETILEDHPFCSGIDAVSTNGDDCCPAGYKCVDDSNPLTPGCILDDAYQEFCSNITFCSDYDNPLDCNNDICRKGSDSSCGSISPNSNEALCGDNYYLKFNCSCSWDSVRGSCSSKSEILRTIYDDSLYNNNCSTNIIHGECTDAGFMRINKLSSMNWDFGLINNVMVQKGLNYNEAIIWLNENCKLDDLCSNQEGVVICSDNVLKLSFFNNYNLIITIIIIALIYTFLGLDKRKH